MQNDITGRGGKQRSHLPWTVVQDIETIIKDLQDLKLELYDLTIPLLAIYAKGSKSEISINVCKGMFIVT